MDLICQDVHFGLGEKKSSKEFLLRLRGINFYDTWAKWKWKTSLLKLLYRQERADKGLISLDGKPLEHWSLKETASKWQLLPSLINCSLIVPLRNRLAGKNASPLFSTKEKERDYALVQDALVKVDMLEKKLVSIRLFQVGRNSESY